MNFFDLRFSANGFEDAGGKMRISSGHMLGPNEHVDLTALEISHVGHQRFSKVARNGPDAVLQLRRAEACRQTRHCGHGASHANSHRGLAEELTSAKALHRAISPWVSEARSSWSCGAKPLLPASGTEPRRGYVTERGRGCRNLPDRHGTIQIRRWVVLWPQMVSVAIHIPRQSPAGLLPTVPRNPAAVTRRCRQRGLLSGGGAIPGHGERGAHGNDSDNPCNRFEQVGGGGPSYGQ